MSLGLINFDTKVLAEPGQACLVPLETHILGQLHCAVNLLVSHLVAASITKLTVQGPHVPGLLVHDDLVGST